MAREPRNIVSSVSFWSDLVIGVCVSSRVYGWDSRETEREAEASGRAARGFGTLYPLGGAPGGVSRAHWGMKNSYASITAKRSPMREREQ